jgi:hypothetical protein
MNEETAMAAMARAVQVRLGVLGWEFPAWERDFYPEGMPVEWRLTYFNTQFECVYLRTAQWQHATPDVHSQWAEDTHEHFRFLLQVDKGAARAEAAASIPPEQFAGKALCLEEDAPDIIWFDAQTDIKALSARLSAAMSSDVYVLSLDGNLAQIERVRVLVDLLGMRS